MEVRISLSHPDEYVRGKTGLLCGWTVPMKKTYSYSKVSKPGGAGGIVMLDETCMMPCPEPHPDLVEQGFEETVTEYPCGEARVKVYIEVVNRTDDKGWSTLMGAVWPHGYRIVEVDERYVEIVAK